MDSLKGRVAVVSGASSGMGADLAKQLALKGLIIAGLDIRKERVEQIAKEVGNKGKIHAIKCNVADVKQVSEAFEWIDKNLGAITVLINNAGLSRAVNFEGETNLFYMRTYRFLRPDRLPIIISCHFSNRP